MAQLEPLTPSAALRGVLPDALVTVVSVQWYGSEALELTYKTATGKVANQLLYRHDEPRLDIVEQGRPWYFDGDGALFRLVADVQRIRLAHLFDPLLAIHTSNVAGAATITVSKNEVRYSLNKPDDFILAIVEFDGDAHRVHYVRRPFQREPDFGVMSVSYSLKWLWSNQANSRHCLRVSITAHPQRGFAEFPDDAALAGFDASDRKFVAVALGSQQDARVLNASE